MSNHYVLANALRMLSVDAIEAAQSGHPGMPMGMADIATVLWRSYLRHNPANPGWWNRDRFVLSNGHGAMLHYALLHLTGYDISISDLKSFRQLGSKTPGHPEYGHTPGIETTTGPLGQGLGNAVGMAIAEASLAATFNQPSFPIIDHYTYVFLGDGCLMEGVSHEVCSLAGTLGLSKLIAFYDDNQISIDGDTSGWFTDGTAARFRAYGWHVVEAVDGHDPDAIDAAIKSAMSQHAKPTLVICKTIIGHGSPNVSGKAQAHGAPLGSDELALVRGELKWPHEPFDVPDSTRKAWSAAHQGASLQNNWSQLFEAYKQAFPALAVELSRRMAGELPTHWVDLCAQLLQSTMALKKGQATRQTSLACLNHLAPNLPELIGGSADLTPSNLTAWQGCEVLHKAQPGGNYIHYGVREFGMATIMNGLAVHGGFVPYGGTFLTFVDYMRNAVRLSAMMGLPVIYVLTHDAIGLGEDGPTHQPIEHLTMLRTTPGLHTWRPADATETAVAWQVAIERKDGPTVLALSRQSLPLLPHAKDQHQAIRQGAYIVKASSKPATILIATGAEVALAMAAAEALEADGVPVQVVSMPCVELFLQQPEAYQAEVIPKDLPVRVVIEAGSTALWWRFAGDSGAVIGIDTFGASAPGPDLYQHFGLTSEHIVATVQERLAAVGATTTHSE